MPDAEPVWPVDNDAASDRCLCCGGPLIALGKISGPLEIPFSSHRIRLARPQALARCHACGSWSKRFRIPDQELTRLYTLADSGQRWERGDFSDHHRPEVVAAVAGLAPAGSSVCDVGCGQARLLDFVAARGCRTAGVEPSDQAAASARSRGHAISHGMEGLGTFDLVTAFDVIEHVSDPTAFLAGLRRLVRPGGHLILLTGDPTCPSARLTGRDWWYARYPEHVVFPSWTWLRGAPGFDAITRVRTWAAKAYRPTLRSRVSSLRRLASGSYDGLPALGPDHGCYVLRAAR